jgi:iron-sulfur cluster assembly protein
MESNNMSNNDATNRENRVNSDNRVNSENKVNLKPVILTPAAATYIKGLLNKSPEAQGFRVRAKPAGCSGYKYEVDVASKISETDIASDSNGVTVVVDEISFPLLQGMIIDCVQEGLNQVLKFTNDNAVGTCGCGESFSVAK